MGKIFLLVFILCCGLTYGVVGDDSLANLIANSTNGVVVLESGTYNASMNMLYGQNLTFRSESGNFNDVIIDCGNTTAMVIQGGPNANNVTTVSFFGVTFTNCATSIFINTTNTTGSCSVAISNCLFQSNSAQRGGAIYAQGSNISLDIRDSIFYNNSGRNLGGAIFAANGVTMQLQNTLFESNAAGYGGGIYIINGCELTMYNSNFTNNFARFTAGGIYLAYNSAGYIHATLFSNNAARSGAGAICADTSTSVLYECTLNSNVANRGGAILVDSLHSAAMIYNTNFFDNEAQSTGGAICATSGGQLVIKNTSLTLNRAYNGGALALITDCYGVLTDVTLENNSAQQGGGLYIKDYSQIKVQSSNVVYNAADMNGDSVYCANSIVRFNDTIVAPGTNKTTEKNGVFCDAVPNYTWCTIDAQGSGNWTGVCAEPDFVVVVSEMATWKIVLIAVGTVIGALMMGFAAAYLISRKFHAPAFFQELTSTRSQGGHTPGGDVEEDCK